MMISDISFYNSFVLSSACLAVAIGSMLLVPTTIVCHDVLLFFPNNYYLQWLSRHLVYTLWNRIFWASNLCIFVLLPLAYFYHEASGFGQSFKGVMWRIYESFVVWLLFTAALGGFIFLARSLYTSSQATPDYSPFAYSLMSLVGSLFILWYTPGGIVVLGRASIDLFRTYKVLVPANRQELLFESEALKFKLQKIEAQRRSIGSQLPDGGISVQGGALGVVHSFNPSRLPTAAIWTKSLLVPTLEPGHGSAEKRIFAHSPSQALQHAVSLQQQMIQASHKTNGGNHSQITSPPSPSEFVSSPNLHSRFSEAHSSTNASSLAKGYNHLEQEANHRILVPTIDSHEVLSKEEMETAPCSRQWPRVVVDDQISTLRRMVQQNSVGMSGMSAGVRRGLGIEPMLPRSPVSALRGLSSDESRWHSPESEEDREPNDKRDGIRRFLPKLEFWAQEVDWREADSEHAIALTRLKQVEQELAKYATELFEGG